MLRPLTTSILLTIMCACSLSASDRTRLGDVRKKFVNQKVIILGDMTSPLAYLTMWEYAKDKKGVYVSDGKGLGKEFIGHEATIVAVQGHELFGSPHLEDDAMVEFIDIIFQLENGKYALLQTSTVSAESSAFKDFELVVVRDEHKRIAFETAQKLHGKAVYLVAYSKLYDMGLNVADMIAVSRSEHAAYSAARISHFPILEPIPVTEAKYSQEYDVFMLVLKLPDGRAALAIPTFDEHSHSYFGPSVAPVLDAVPTELTPEEVQAIHNGHTFKGMSKNAVIDLLGLPDHENDYGSGGTQVVWGEGGSLIYYFDKDDKLEDRQSFN